MTYKNPLCPKQLEVRVWVHDIEANPEKFKLTCIMHNSSVFPFLYTASTTAIDKPTRLKTLQVSTQFSLSGVDTQII